MLDFIATGELIIDEVRRHYLRRAQKSAWWVASYKARIAKFEYLVENDKEVYADDELADLIQGDW